MKFNISTLEEGIAGQVRNDALAGNCAGFRIEMLKKVNKKKKKLS